MITIDQPVLDPDIFQKAAADIVINREFSQNLKRQHCLEKYSAWKSIKYQDDTEHGFNPKHVWAMLNGMRRNNRIPLPMIDEDSEPFCFWNLPRYQKFFRDFDSLCSGQILSDSPLHKRIFIQNGELEESIYSSKIEGAVTTISEAKIMIQQDRNPRNKSEQMIINNYETMKRIRTEWHEQPLSLELLFTMHQTITQQTDIRNDQIGRLRTNADNIKVIDELTGEIAHIPPDEKFLQDQIIHLINFANDTASANEDYWHPLVKAIVLHFWIGYLHPFADGNGRLARSLFYWYLLRNGYWAIPFIPISAKISRSPAQYRDAYLLTEQVDNDFNYFFEYHLRQIKLAIADFKVNLSQLRQQKTATSSFVRQGFNDRQAELLQYFLVKPDGRTNISIHQHYHQVSYLTARSDLLHLEEEGLLSSRKSGRTLWFWGEVNNIQPLIT